MFGLLLIALITLLILIGAFMLHPILGFIVLLFIILIIWGSINS